MIIKECNQLIGQQHLHIERVKIQYIRKKKSNVANVASGKTNALFNLINHEPDIIYLYAKDPYEAKYQLLINKREITG